MSNENQVKQEEINAIAWKACDTFRGVMDSSQYKDYILVFLFLKYVSDLWIDKKEELLKLKKIAELGWDFKDENFYTDILFPHFINEISLNDYLGWSWSSMAMVKAFFRTVHFLLIFLTYESSVSIYLSNTIIYICHVQIVLSTQIRMEIL